eukprot:4188934-Amphidinium_carterae.2
MREAIKMLDAMRPAQSAQHIDFLARPTIYRDWVIASVCEEHDLPNTGTDVVNELSSSLRLSQPT